jgi:hypothetical protein
MTFGTGQVSIARTYSRGQTTWLAVPGFPMAQYRITAPQLEVSLDGTVFSLRVRGDVGIRTTAKRPNGTPWASAQVHFAAAVNAQGQFTLDLPPWPSVGDPYGPARAACRQTARAVNPLPDFPEKPPRPQRPAQNAPPWEWSNYTTAKWTYDHVTYPAYLAAKKAYETAVDGLNDALEACQDLYPQPPALPALAPLTLGLNAV